MQAEQNVSFYPGARLVMRWITTTLYMLAGIAHLTVRPGEAGLTGALLDLPDRLYGRCCGVGFIRKMLYGTACATTLRIRLGSASSPSSASAIQRAPAGAIVPAANRAR
jgi:hypothetical protein